MSEQPDKTETTPPEWRDQPPCEHGIPWIVVCPQCEPAAYERAHAQVVRRLEADRLAGKPMPRSL